MCGIRFRTAAPQKLKSLNGTSGTNLAQVQLIYSRWNSLSRLSKSRFREIVDKVSDGRRFPVVILSAPLRAITLRFAYTVCLFNRAQLRIINCSVSSVSEWTSHSRTGVRLQISGLHVGSPRSSWKTAEAARAPTPTTSVVCLETSRCLDRLHANGPAVYHQATAAAANAADVCHAVPINPLLLCH